LYNFSQDVQEFESRGPFFVCWKRIRDHDTDKEGRAVLGTERRRDVSADAISNAMEGWKKGHSDVLESGHTLILGWSDKITSLVDQLCMANQSEGGRPIVVLAEMEKEEMEEIFSRDVPNHRGSRIICRLPYCTPPLQECWRTLAHFFFFFSFEISFHDVQDHRGD
jgi:hypothetical protein